MRGDNQPRTYDDWFGDADDMGYPHELNGDLGQQLVAAADKIDTVDEFGKVWNYSRPMRLDVLGACGLPVEGEDHEPNQG